MENHSTANRRRITKRRKIRPIPILMAGFLIDAVCIGLTALFLGTLAYFFQWKIEHFQMLATIVYLLDIYISSLLVSFIAGHRYPLLPLGNGLICLAASLLLLGVNQQPITENLATKVGLVFAASLFAYLTVKVTSVSLTPKKKSHRISIAERSKTTERSFLEIP